MAKGKKAIEVVEDIVRPVCDELGLILWDVRFEKEGPEWFLRVFIDKDGDEGIFIEDCENLSRRVDPLIDEADPIKEGYYFEVSSAGLGRKLTKELHFKKKIGEIILVKLIHAVDKKREFEGELVDFIDGEIHLKTNQDEVMKILLKDTSFVKLCDDKDLF